MRTVDFHALSRAAQDHFVDATTGAEPPPPLLVIEGAPSGHRVGWGAAGVGLVGLVALGLVGFGDLDSGLAIHGVAFAALWVALVALAAFGVLHALAGDRENAVLPWKPGVYLFAHALVDARRYTLRVFDVDALERVEDAGAGLRVTYAGESFTFPGDAERVSRAKAAIEDARARGPASDPKARASHDPLAEPRVSSPLAPTEPRRRTVPAWARGRIPIAAAVGAAIGLSLFRVRDVASDDRMFAAAKTKDDVASYRAYLKRGVRHRGEVEGVLLPRAELRLAVRDGSVDAVAAYAKAHGSSKIKGEIDAALRKALLAELDEAKKAGTLAALKAFAKRRPDHGLDDELKAAKHDVYAAALAKAKAQSNDKDPQVAAFFARLLAWAEAHDEPKVEIRLRLDPSTTLGKADKVVTKQAMFNGETSYPTRYFDAKKIAPHQESLAKALVARLSSAFPAELIAPAVSATFADDDVATIKVPTLFVTHHADWTGTAYASNKPRGVYVGVQWSFRTAFVIPGDPKKLEGKSAHPRNVPLDVVGKYAKIHPQVPGDPERAIYDAMTAGAFEAFSTRFLGGLFAGK